MADTDLNSKRRVWLTGYAPLFVWIGVIFYLSSSSGSMTATSRFIGPLLEYLFPAASEETHLTIHFFIRKLAHITEYAILGFLAMRAIIDRSQTVRSTLAFASASLLVVCVAIADEFNQSFQSSRTSSAGDVVLDCVGGILAICLYVAINGYLETRRISRRSNP